MNTHQLKLTFKYLTWTMLIIVGMIMIIQWTAIPDIIGIHINLSGNIDRYDSKVSIIVIWFIVVIIQLLYTFDYRLKSGGFNTDIFNKYPLFYHTIYFICIICISSFFIVRILC